MKQPDLFRVALASIALAATVAAAQTVPRTTTSSGPSTQASGVSGLPAPGAASTSGFPSLAGALPEGTGSNGRAIVIVMQPPGTGTNVMGAGTAAPRRPLSAVDIASMFLAADTNRDGELSRAEAQALQLPMSFDELDTNHDGVISRFEFDEAYR